MPLFPRFRLLWLWILYRIFAPTGLISDVTDKSENQNSAAY